MPPKASTKKTKSAAKKEDVLLDNINQDQEIDTMDLMQEALLALKAKDARKSSGPKMSQAFMTLDAIPEDTPLPLTPFTLQYAFGRTSFMPGTMVELIGPEHVGKTTFVFTLFGMFMTACPNIMALYVNTEGRNKLFDIQRIKSCLAADKQVADKYMRQICMLEGHAQKETLESIDLYCKTMRESMTAKGIPTTTPILVAIDTLSKLMPQSEARSLGYGESTKAKGLGESSNLEFSKLLQEWCRARVEFLEKYNVFMILVSHQNTKINMTMMPGARPVSDANNKTKIGGNAINQSAVAQFTLTRIESDVNVTTKELISHIIKLNVVKNSRGPDKRFINYELRVGNLKDTDTHYEPAINFNYGLADLFVLKKLFNCTMKTKTKFGCKGLGLGSDADRQTIADTFLANPETVSQAGTSLGIYGYSPSIIDPAIQKVNQAIAEEAIVDDEELAAAIEGRSADDDTIGFSLDDELDAARARGDETNDDIVDSL